MEEKSLDDTLDCLMWISINKKLIPPEMVGWVSHLGLYVRSKEGGKRILAGGMWRSYIDARASNERHWHIVKFDRSTWLKRFVPILEPTLEISDYLSRYADGQGLHGEFARVYWDAIRHYRSTGEWVGLAVSGEMRVSAVSQGENERIERLSEAHEKAIELIRELEHRVEVDPLAPLNQDRTYDQLRELYAEPLVLGVRGTRSPLRVNSSRYVLEDLYERFQTISLILGRVKDYENATKGLLHVKEISPNRFPEDEAHARLVLGMFYVTALAHKTRGVGNVWPTSIRSDISPESLGYSSDQVRDLAISNLTRVGEYYRDALLGEDDEEFAKELKDSIEELDLGLKATNSMCASDFDEIDNFYAQRDEAEDARLGIDTQMRANLDAIG